MSILVNKTKAILSGAVVFFLGGFGIYYLINSMYPAAPIFLIFAAIYAYLFYQAASTITITEASIIRSFFGIVVKKLLWSEIQELGLIGENVFNKRKEKTGEKYIYFSPVKMNKDERFQMVVKWPPKDMLYLKYSAKTLEYTQSIWGKDLKTYHVEDLFPNTDD